MTNALNAEGDADQNRSYEDSSIITIGPDEDRDEGEIEIDHGDVYRIWGGRVEAGLVDIARQALDDAILTFDPELRVPHQIKYPFDEINIPRLMDHEDPIPRRLSRRLRIHRQRECVGGHPL